METKKKNTLYLSSLTGALFFGATTILKRLHVKPYRPCRKFLSCIANASPDVSDFYDAILTPELSRGP